MESHSSHWILSLKSCKYNIARFYCHGNTTAPCKELKGVKGETLITPLSPTSPPPHHHTTHSPHPPCSPSPHPPHHHTTLTVHTRMMSSGKVKYLVAMLRGLSLEVGPRVQLPMASCPHHTEHLLVTSVLVYTPIKRIRVADAWTCRPFYTYARDIRGSDNNHTSKLVKRGGFFGRRTLIFVRISYKVSQ